MSTSSSISKLWKLAKELRNSGLDYMEYTIEITLPLFLKMSVETNQEKKIFPKNYSWQKLIGARGQSQLNYYNTLINLLAKSKDNRINKIFKNTQTAITKPVTLTKILDTINQLDWFSAKEEGLGDFYEALLEKTGSEGGKGAGQYFTPREIINLAVRIIKPKNGEIIQDPSLGTGGFIKSANKYIKDQTDQLFDLNPAQIRFQKNKAFNGFELVPKVFYLFLMNMLLNDIDGNFYNNNTLSADGKNLEKADVILANPPFGVSTDDSLIDRDDFLFQTNNKQLAFLQHIYRNLKNSGRAAVIFPDGVLFEEGLGKKIRIDFINKCKINCILRLPNGIFLNSKGNRTNIIFFEKGKSDLDNTKEILYYDLRTNSESFGKRNRITQKHFYHFEQVYKKIIDKKSIEINEDKSDKEKYKIINIDEIKNNDYDLDIRWIKDYSKLDFSDVVNTTNIITNLKSINNEINISIDKLHEDLKLFNFTNTQKYEDLLSFVPKNWGKSIIKNQINIFDSKRIPLNEEERRTIKGDYPYYGANGIVDKINKFIFNGDFILVAEDGGYFDDARINIAYQAIGKFWVNNHAHIIQAKNIKENRFFMHLINSINWTLDARGGTRDKLGQEDLMNKIIKLPNSEEERVRISETIDKIFLKIDSIFLNLKKIDIDPKRSEFAHLYPSFIIQALNGRLKI
jgi:type I restriction enzyme M protein